MPDLVAETTQIFDTLTKTQKQVAEYFLTNKESIAFDTLDEIAAKIDVSTTTVIRFARSLGFKGYSDMQTEVQNVIREKAALPQRLNDAMRVNHDKLLLESFQNDVNNINITLSMLSENEVKRAADVIAKARTVYVLGMRSSFALAHYTMSRIGQVRTNMRLIQAAGQLYPEEIIGAGQPDVCVAFLFSRQSKTTADILSWLKKWGVTVVLFTNTSTETVKALGDVILQCNVKGVSYKNSFAAPICLINYLASAVAMNNYPEAMKTLAQTEDILRQGYYLEM